MCQPSWTNEGAPIPTQPFTIKQLIWFPVLAAITKVSIDGLYVGNTSVSIFWIIYESYIVFDHFPFFFANNVYKSPTFNYENLSLIFFWGLEAVASIVATQSVVRAPIILLYNAAPHSLFIFANCVRGAATSNAFVAESKKSRWILLQVSVDTTIHCMQLWYHIKYLHHAVNKNDDSSLFPFLSWTALFTLSVLLTCWVHRDEMSWSHFTAVMKNK